MYNNILWLYECFENFYVKRNFWLWFFIYIKRQKSRLSSHKVTFSSFLLGVFNYHCRTCGIVYSVFNCLIRLRVKILSLVSQLYFRTNTTLWYIKDHRFPKSISSIEERIYFKCLRLELIEIYGYILTLSSTKTSKLLSDEIHRTSSSARKAMPYVIFVV